jgi:hypothetical protein
VHNPLGQDDVDVGGNVATKHAGSSSAGINRMF